MADSKRGGRSDDDEFDEAELDEFSDDLDDADVADDDLDDEADDDEGDEADEDDDARSTRVARRSGTAAKTARARASSPPKKRSRAKADASLGLVGRLVRFVREVVAELQKVIWPTRKELLTYTSVVVVFVTIMMTVVALLDLGFLKSMFLVFGGKTTSTGQ